MKSLKILKGKSYYSRFQVKWRRRREGKTDYYFRKRIISQDKRKYNSPKYRVVVRISKHNILCQFVSSNIEGDKVINSSYSKKLSKFGILFGFTNFPSAYLCGIYLSKSILSGKNILTKSHFFLNQAVSQTIKASLDIGLTRATAGHKVFACMKGVIDGGIAIPHSEKKYPGYSLEKGFDPLMLKYRIKGEHIYDYMKNLKEEDENKFNKYFSSSIKHEISPSIYKDLYHSLVTKLIESY
nr:60S ribosomal protein L5 [Cryptomonas curvata]